METKHLTLVFHHDAVEVTAPRRRNAEKRSKILWTVLYIVTLLAVVFAVTATVYALAHC